MPRNEVSPNVAEECVTNLFMATIDSFSLRRGSPCDLTPWQGYCCHSKEDFFFDSFPLPLIFWPKLRTQHEPNKRNNTFEDNEKEKGGIVKKKKMMKLISNALCWQQQERQDQPCVFLLWFHRLFCGTGGNCSGHARIQSSSTSPALFGASLPRDPHYTGSSTRRTHRTV